MIKITKITINHIENYLFISIVLFSVQNVLVAIEIAAWKEGRRGDKQKCDVTRISPRRGGEVVNFMRACDAHTRHTRAEQHTGIFRIVIFRLFLTIISRWTWFVNSNRSYIKVILTDVVAEIYKTTSNIARKHAIL